MRLQGLTPWIRWVRLAAAPFALLEAAVEDYPPGHEAWAWALAVVFAAGALVLFRRDRPALGLMLDLGVVSGFVVLYAFDPGTPVRQLFFLVVLEAALRYGTLGGALVPLAHVPALALFEWRLAEPFDVGHVLGPFGLQLLVGLVAGRLARSRAPG